MLKEFREFLLRGNVVDLAVGVIIGTAFGTVVTSLVKDVLTPLIAAIGGQPDFSALTLTIHHSPILYGSFLNAVIAFLIVAGVVFFGVIKPMNHLVAKFQRKQPEDPQTRPCPECLSAIPAKATRCAHCTTKIAAA